MQANPRPSLVSCFLHSQRLFRLLAYCGFHSNDQKANALVQEKFVRENFFNAFPLIECKIRSNLRSECHVGFCEGAL